jgi:hypothetical protein
MVFISMVSTALAALRARAFAVFGFGFECGQFTIVYDFLYLRQARII